jgi:adenosylcobinamide kinase / adenosylcobinamide-phosphate guanylyltransferase
MSTTGLTLLIGGARSGKSDLAVQIGQRHTAGVTFIATAEGLDADMSERIKRHQLERPNWPTVEAPLSIGAAVAATNQNHLLIVDCLTLWVANMMFADASDDDIAAAAQADVAACALRQTPTVAVTNEVGLGIHPETELGRRYRDQLGRVNRIWAAGSHRCLFLVAGRAVALHDPWEYLS